MNQFALLLRIFFTERNEDGWKAIGRLIDESDDSTITSYSAGERKSYAKQVLGAGAGRFNLAEATITNSGTETMLRYRPSVSSKYWVPLARPDPTSVSDKDSHELFQLFLTLFKFSNPDLSAQARSTAALELLCRKVTLVETMERTIAVTVNGLCPEVVGAGTWGYADPIPFRGVTVEDEWMAAIGDALLLNPSHTDYSNHQFLFVEYRSPAVKVALEGNTEGNLTIYKLSSLL